MDDKARYKVYRATNGKCHHCGTRLEWDAFEVRGMGGGWVLEVNPEHPEDTEKAQSLCYKCFEFEGRDKSGGRLIIQEN